MIWCLNISTVFSFPGTLAIHSRGQARRQRHETRERERVLPTRESSLPGPEYSWPTGCSRPSRRETREKVVRMLHKSNEDGDGWIGGGLTAFVANSENQKTSLLVLPGFALLPMRNKIKEADSWCVMYRLEHQQVSHQRTIRPGCCQKQAANLGVQYQSETIFPWLEFPVRISYKAFALRSKPAADKQLWPQDLILWVTVSVYMRGEQQRAERVTLLEVLHSQVIWPEEHTQFLIRH